MKTHVQSPWRYICLSKRDADNDILTKVDRHVHTALDTDCPRCESKAGVQCAKNSERTKFLPKLVVHIERQEASL